MIPRAAATATWPEDRRAQPRWPARWAACLTGRALATRALGPLGRAGSLPASSRQEFRRVLHGLGHGKGRLDGEFRAQADKQAAVPYRDRPYRLLFRRRNTATVPYTGTNNNLVFFTERRQTAPYPRFCQVPDL